MKQIDKIIFTLIMFFVSFSGVMAQDYYDTICWVRVNDPSEANAMGYYEDGKLVIVPTTEENGFTDDGYLAIGAAIEIQNDSIVIQEGVYMAYYDEDEGRYVAVAVDYSTRK